MAKALTSARASVKVYDLCSNVGDSVASTYESCKSIRANGCPSPTTPNENVQFVLRNRIDWTNEVTSSRPSVDSKAGASSVGVANIFRVLQVPKNTVVHEVKANIVADPNSDSTPNSWAHSWTGSGGSTTYLCVNAYAYKKRAQTQTASSTVIKAGCFGKLAVTKSGGAVGGLPTYNASTPSTAAKTMGVSVSSCLTQPVYFRHGGFIELQMQGGASTQSITADGTFTGKCEIQARCTRLPE